MRKKAEITMEEVAGLILAVLVLFVLGAGTLSTYSKAKSNEIETIESITSSLKIKIEAVEDKTEIPVQGFSTNENWNILAWGKEERNAPEKEECFSTSCICICAGTNAEACNSKGICELLKVENVKVEMYDFEVNENAGIGDEPIFQKIVSNYIALPKNILLLQIEKLPDEKETILIKYETEDYKEFVK